MVLFPSKITCNIGIPVASTALEAAGYYLGVCFEGTFEGGPSASPDLVFILQQVSLVYHLVPNCNLLECSCWQANTFASEGNFFDALPSLTICLTAHLVGWKCGIKQHSTMGPFCLRPLNRFADFFNCLLESAMTSPDVNSDHAKGNLF